MHLLFHCLLCVRGGFDDVRHRCRRPLRALVDPWNPVSFVNPWNLAFAIVIVEE